jgi:hypothetical protein
MVAIARARYAQNRALRNTATDVLPSGDYPRQERHMHEAENGKAVQVLDLLLEYFGERWTTAMMTTKAGAVSSVLYIISAASTYLQRERGVFSSRGN